MMRVLVTFFFGLVLLIRPLVVLAVILVVIFVTAALPCAGVWAGTLKDLGVSILIVALWHWLDGVDGVVKWLVAALPPLKVDLLTLIMIVVAAVTVVVAPIITTVVMTPIITLVVEAAILLVRARSPANVFLDLLVGLVSICLLLRHCEHVLD
jgi:hypothetical protein